jgi:hypothetical protein
MNASSLGGGTPHCRGIAISKPFCLATAVCLLSGAWLLISADPSDGGDPTPTSKSILDKALAFHGGMKALGRELSLVRVEESEMILDGESIPIKCNWQFQPPNKRAFQAIIKIGGLQLNIRQAVFADKGWIKFGPAAPADLTPEQVVGTSWEHDNHVLNVQILATVNKTHDIGAPEPIRLDKRDAWQIKFVDKQDKKREFTAFFDKTTGQVLGDETVRVLPTLGANQKREIPTKFRVLFNSVLTVDGMKMPETMTIFRDGAPVVYVRKAEVRVVDSIDPKLFQKPE